MQGNNFNLEEKLKVQREKYNIGCSIDDIVATFISNRGLHGEYEDCEREYRQYLDRTCGTLPAEFWEEIKQSLQRQWNEFKNGRSVTKGSRRNKCKVCMKKCSLRCSKCKSVQYCNVTCQKEDWKNHKGQCEREMHARIEIDKTFDAIRKISEQ